MRVDSMDATFKPTVSIEPSKVRQEESVSPAKEFVQVQSRRASKEAAKGENSLKIAEEKISDAFLQSSIDRVNYTFETQRRSVRFKIHDRTNEVMVKIIDADTEEVIREIPPEKLMDMFANMLELAGLLVDERR